MTIQQESVSLDDAYPIIVPTEQKARELGQPENIAVVEAAATSSPAAALIGSIDIAINNALTARAFDISLCIGRQRSARRLVLGIQSVYVNHATAYMHCECTTEDSEPPGLLKPDAILG